MLKPVFHDNLTIEQATSLYNSEWWKDCSPEKIVSVQLFTKRLIMPFGDFQAAVEAALGRPVWTHEFAYARQLQDEFLKEKPAPTFEEILNLIPKDKLIVVIIND